MVSGIIPVWTNGDGRMFWACIRAASGIHSLIDIYQLVTSLSILTSCSFFHLHKVECCTVGLIHIVVCQSTNSRWRGASVRLLRGVKIFWKLAEHRRSIASSGS